MPSIRIGFSTDFNLTGEQIGIGTTNPTARLDVVGQIVSEKTVDRGGISTITRYGGFLDESQGLGNNVSIAETTKGNLNSLSGEIKISGEVTVTEDTKLTGGRLDSLTVTGKFDLPHGGSEDREDTPEKGSTRFNQDLGQLEFYTGYEWRTVNSYDGSGRGRGVVSGGTYAGGYVATSAIEFVNINSLGNSQNFGTLTATRANHSGCSSSIRGVYGGGNQPAGNSTNINIIEYITIASEGNSIDFGDLTQARLYSGSCSSSTRGLWGGGYNTPLNANQNTIDYVQISTLGNALDFGDLTITRRGVTSTSSPTRGFWGHGITPASPFNRTSIVDYVTIASTGNAVTFGNLLNAINASASLSNGIRGIYAGGAYTDYHKTIEYITLSSTGNSVYFGDLISKMANIVGTSTQTRGIFTGGEQPSPGSFFLNSIQFITIASTGNAQDFGDLTSGRNAHAACSDSHGGLGGF